MSCVRWRWSGLRPRRVPTRRDIGQITITLGFFVLGLAVGVSSLTFNWVLEHRSTSNYFPEFAGRVVYLSDILVIAGISICLAGRFLARSERLRLGPWYVAAPLFTLLALSALSVLWAADPSQAAIAAERRVWLLGLYVMAVNGSGKALVPMVIALFGVGLLQAGVALAQVALGGPTGLTMLGEIPKDAHFYTAIGQPRALGLGLSPNPPAMYLAVVGSLAYGVLLLLRGGFWVKALTFATFAATFSGMMATGSRAALLGCMLAIVVVTALSWLSKGGLRGLITRHGLVAVPLVVAVFVLVPYLVYTSAEESVLSRVSPTHYLTELRGRFREIELSGPIIRDNLLLGVGAQNYPQEIKARVAPNRLGGGFVPVHNVPALVTAEHGVPGGIVWAVLMIAPFIWFVSAWRHRAFDPRVLLWLGPLVVVLFVSLFEFSPWATQDGRVMLWALIGLWAGSWSHTGSPVPIDQRRPQPDTAPENPVCSVG